MTNTIKTSYDMLISFPDNLSKKIDLGWLKDDVYCMFRCFITTSLRLLKVPNILQISCRERWAVKVIKLIHLNWSPNDRENPDQSALPMHHGLSSYSALQY